MHRLTRGMAWAAALSLVAACSGDPTEPLRGDPVALSLNPDVVVPVKDGDSVSVDVQVLDEQGNPLPIENFSIVRSSSASFLTSVNENLDPVFDENGDLVVPEERTTAQFYVRATALAAGYVVVSANGLTDSITVRSVPGDLEVTFSNTAPALGEAVTITAPAQTSFTDSTTVTFGPLPNGRIIELTPTTITFVPPPNAAGKPVITDVRVAYLGGDFSTSETLTTPVVEEFVGTFSSTTPAAGEVVTLTAGPGFAFSTEADAVTASVGGLSVLNLTVAPDGSSISFVPAPEATGAVALTGVLVAGFPLDLPADQEITVGAASAQPGTLAEPASGASYLFFDAPTFPDDLTAVFDFPTVGQPYILTVTEAADYVIAVPAASNAADLGIYVFDNNSGAFVGSGDGHGTGDGSVPEVAELSLAPGEYLVYIAHFQYDFPAPTWYGLEVTRLAPAAPSPAAAARATTPRRQVKSLDR